MHNNVYLAFIWENMIPSLHKLDRLLGYNIYFLCIVLTIVLFVGIFFRNLFLLTCKINNIREIQIFFSYWLILIISNVVNASNKSKFNCSNCYACYLNYTV